VAGTGLAGGNGAAPDDLVLVGTIERPHGLRGEVAVNPLTDFGGERFVTGATLTTARAGQTPDGSTSLTIDDVRWHKGRPLVLFDGVEMVEAADALRQGLWIASSARPALEPGCSTRRISWAAGSRRCGRTRTPRGRSVGGRARRGRAGALRSCGRHAAGRGAGAPRRRHLPGHRPGRAADRDRPAGGLLEAERAPATPRRALKRGRTGAAVAANRLGEDGSGKAFRGKGGRSSCASTSSRSSPTWFGVRAQGIVARAHERVVDLAVHDLRDHDDRHRVVDDSPFGGGPGWC
jgi:hypothetical protein